MSTIIWIIGVIAGLVLLLLGIFVWRVRKKGGHEPDYRTFFTLGIIWFPLGIALDMPFFFILGLAYMAIGLANRNKWKKQKPLTQGQKWLAAVGVIILVIAVAVTYLLGARLVHL